MNKTRYWIIGIIIIVAVGYGGYRLIKHYQNASMYNTQPTSATTQNVNPTTPPVGNATTGSNELMNKTDTSNQQLDQDLQDIQGSMNKLNSDQNQAGQAVSNQSSDTPSQ